MGLNPAVASRFKLRRDLHSAPLSPRSRGDDLRRPTLHPRRFHAETFRSAEQLSIEPHALEPIMQAEEVGEAHAAVDLRGGAGNKATDLGELGLGVGGDQRALRRARRRRAWEAYHTSARQGSSWAAISAQRCLTAWNEPITRPNWRRSLA